jgi:DNA-binding MarR family transcriptional regulator
LILTGFSCDLIDWHASVNEVLQTIYQKIIIRKLVIKKISEMENQEIILKVLKENGAMKPGDIAGKAGISKSEVDKAIKQLKAEDQIFSPKRCFYELKG